MLLTSHMFRFYFLSSSVMVKYLLIFGFISVLQGASFAQKVLFTGHSHNDYYNERPFYDAYENFFGSIEVDVWAIEGELFVAHDKDEITREKTLKSLYIDPILEVFQQNNGKPWKNYSNTFILLVDLKTSYKPALDLLAVQLKKYPEVFDPSVNPSAVMIVVSGNTPEPELYHRYPSFIYFDGRIKNAYTVAQLQRVPLFSNSFKDYSQWDGTGIMPAKDRRLIEEYVQQVQDLGKKVRFWAIPDTPQVWELFMDLHVDLINTDKPSDYQRHFSKN